MSAGGASEPDPPLLSAVGRSRALRNRAHAHREAARDEAATLVAAARQHAEVIRTASDARVAQVLDRADREARGVVAAARAEAERLDASARRADARPDVVPAALAPLVAGGLLLLVAGCGVALAVGPGTAPAVVAAVVTTLVCPGLGIVLALGPAAGPYRGVTTLLLSACWSGAVALGAAWTTLQSPVVQYAALVAPALAGAGVALRRGRGPLPTRPIWRADGSALRWPARPTRNRPARIAILTGWLLLPAAATAYVLALRGSAAQPVGDYGLLPTLGPLFVVAVTLAVAGVVVACLVRPVTVGLAAASLGVVGLLLTPPRVIFEPNLLAGWAYKHLGAVDLVVQQQALQDPRDVFQQWPGFFALAAQVEVLSGADPLRYANLAQPLFVALAAVGLATAVHRLYADAAAAAVATLLFLTTMWAGQFYYSPQTLGFALVMLCLPLVITLLGSLPQDRMREGWFGRLAPWALRGLSGPRPVPPGVRRVLVATIVATYLLVVVSHQITPYVLVLQLAPAALVGWLSGRWRWGYVGLATLPVLWLALHHEVLDTNTALTGFSFANAQSLVTGPSSDAQQLAATLARVVAVVVLGGGALAALTRVRRLGTVLVPLMLGVMPAFVLLGGNYGGEAPYRVWLFAAPWFCVLIANRVAGLVRHRAAAVVTVGALSVATFLASAQATTFGMYPFLRVSDGQVAASRWLAEDTPPGSTIVHLTRMFPGRISAGYAERNPLHLVNDPALVDYPRFDPELLLALTPAELALRFEAEFGDQAYLVVARAMEAETRYYGVLPGGAVTELAADLAASPAWTVAYAADDVWVFTPR